MKRYMVPALLLAVVLVVAFTTACTTPPRKASREEFAPRGDAELQSRVDQLEKNNAAAIRDIRTGQANLGADLGAVRDELRTLRGQMEGMGKSQNLKKQLDELAIRVENIETFPEEGQRGNGLAAIRSGGGGAVRGGKNRPEGRL